MFFGFYILVLTIYLSSTNNYVLKKKHIQEDLGHYENQMKVQGVKNKSWLLSTHKPLFEIIQDLAKTKSSDLKSNVFDKRLSEEMLSIKQYIYDQDWAYSTPTTMKSKISIATPTLELKQKWPIVNLVFKSDDLPGSLQYIDEFEKIYLINTTMKQTDFTTVKSTIAVETSVEKNNEQKEIKDKVVGLRSLLIGSTPTPGRFYSIAIKQCTCAKTSPTTTVNARRTSSTSHNCTHNTTPHKCTAHSIRLGCADCSRTPSHSILPYYVPYEMMAATPNLPNFYYPPYIFEEVEEYKPPKHHKRPRPSIEDDLYYEDSFDREKYAPDKYEDDYLEHDREKEKKLKWKHDKEAEVIVHYEDASYVPSGIPESKNISWKTKFHNENPDVLANNILEDLKSNYSDTIIKKCYCASCAHNLKFIGVWCLLFLLCLFLFNLEVLN